MNSREGPLVGLPPLAVLLLALAVLAVDHGHLGQALRNAQSSSHGEPLTRPAWAGFLGLAFLGLAGSVFGLLWTRFGMFWAALPVSAAMFVAGALSWRLRVADRVLLDAIGPDVALVAMMATAAAARFLDTSLTRLRLRTAFADTLPRAAIETLVR